MSNVIEWKIPFIFYRFFFTPSLSLTHMVLVQHAHFGFILSDKTTVVIHVVTPKQCRAQYSPVQPDMIDESFFNYFKIFLYQVATAKTRTNEMY